MEIVLFDIMEVFISSNVPFPFNAVSYCSQQICKRNHSVVSPTRLKLSYNLAEILD